MSLSRYRNRQGYAINFLLRKRTPSISIRILTAQLSHQKIVYHFSHEYLVVALRRIMTRNIIKINSRDALESEMSQALIDKISVPAAR